MRTVQSRATVRRLDTTHRLAMVLALVLASLAFSRVSQALTFDAAADVVRAHEGEVIVWEHNHRDVLVSPGAPVIHSIVGPVQSGPFVYYAVGLSLYQVTAATGGVVRRTLLPGVARSLQPAGEGVTVTVGPASDRFQRGDPNRWSVRYQVVPGDAASAVPFFASAYSEATRTRREAVLVTEEIAAASPNPPPRRSRGEWRRQPEFRPIVERAITELARRAVQDPTNPWLDLERAQRLADIGRGYEARMALNAPLNHDRRYDFELLPISRVLDLIDRDMSDRAFQRGMRFLLANGYEPELTLYLGGLGARLTRVETTELRGPSRDAESLGRRADRIWDVAPYAEGAAFFYQAVADAFERSGDAVRARVWRQRAQLARPYASLGDVGSLAEYAGVGLNLAAACLLALLLTFLVKTLRTWTPPETVSNARLRWILPARWTRLEALGFVLVFALLIDAGWLLSRGVSALETMARAPATVLSGSLGHPESVSFWRETRREPAADFVRAIGLQQSGDTAGAERIYRALGTPEAKVNLGVILHARGQEAEARALFAEARRQRPYLAEAAFNLGENASSGRIARAQRWGQTGPLLALPDERIWAAAWLAKTRNGRDWTDDVGSALESLSQAKMKFLGSARIAWWLIVALSATALIGIFAPRSAEPVQGGVPRVRTLGWILGLIVPGGARQYGPIGPLFLAAFLFMAYIALALKTSHGGATSPMDAVMMPGFSRYYGVISPMRSVLQNDLRRLAALWWVPLAANAVFVVLAERFAPDPNGWIAARSRARVPAEVASEKS